MKTLLNDSLSISVVILLLEVGLALLPIQANAVPGEGTLYGTSPDNLIIVNRGNGAGTVVGLIALEVSFPGLAIDPLTGWGFADCGTGCDDMWNINLATGMGTHCLVP